MSLHRDSAWSPELTHDPRWSGSRSGFVTRKKDGRFPLASKAERNLHVRKGPLPVKHARDSPPLQVPLTAALMFSSIIAHARRLPSLICPHIHESPDPLRVLRPSREQYPSPRCQHSATWQIDAFDQSRYIFTLHNDQSTETSSLAKRPITANWSPSRLSNVQPSHVKGRPRDHHCSSNPDHDPDTFQ